MSKQDDKFEVITLYRGKDSATYLASEFMELGEDATPISIRQNPTENGPYHEMKLEDTDAIEFYKEPPKRQDEGTDLPKWDLSAMKRLLEAHDD